jgi:hypothetical protein
VRGTDRELVGEPARRRCPRVGIVASGRYSRVHATTLTSASPQMGDGRVGGVSFSGGTGDGRVGGESFSHCYSELDHFSFRAQSFYDFVSHSTIVLSHFFTILLSHFVFCYSELSHFCESVSHFSLLVNSVILATLFNHF